MQWHRWIKDKCFSLTSIYVGCGLSDFRSSQLANDGEESGSKICFSRKKELNLCQNKPRKLNDDFRGSFFLQQLMRITRILRIIIGGITWISEISIV